MIGKTRVMLYAENVEVHSNFTDQFEEIYQKIENAGEIMENNGVETFNFSDPEGNYFVIGKL